MKVTISGYSGFLGTNLSSFLREKGYEVMGLNRSDLDMPAKELAALLEGTTVMINLAGSPILARWTRRNRKQMVDSRVNTVKKTVEAFGMMEHKPAAFLSASAVGIYNPSGIHDEYSQDYARDDLGQLVQNWEHEIHRSVGLGVRTVIFRLGIVLGKNGGALPRIVLPYRLGLGGPIGSGKQPFPFVHITDVCSAFLAAIENIGMKGIYNLAAPQATSFGHLAKTVGKIMRKPSLVPVPAIALRMVYGQGATILLSGQHVVPRRLSEEGFPFRYPDLHSCLEDLLSS